MIVRSTNEWGRRTNEPTKIDIWIGREVCILVGMILEPHGIWGISPIGIKKDVLHPALPISR